MERKRLIKVTRIFDAIPELLRKGNVQDAFSAKENGVWIKYSTQQFSDYTNNLSCGLLNLGVQREDKIAIIANNRPEWNFTDFAIQQVGAISVPIYPTISASDLEFILNDAQVKYIFVSSEELYKHVKAIAAKISSVKEIYTYNKVNGAKHWMEIVDLGKQNPKVAEVEAIKKTIKPSDLLTILYTSGTTGNPKGVMLSHNNLLSNVYACESDLPAQVFVKKTWKVLSFLPLNHVYERMMVTAYILGGASIYYAESIETIGENLKEVQPDGFASVPRIFEKVYEKIMATGHALEGVKRKIFTWAIDLGFQYELEGKNGWWYEKKLNIARKLVFSKWKEAVGGHLISSMSGGAALQPRLARIFAAAEIPICEGYGLTETSPVIASNSLDPGMMRFGTVGKVVEGVTVKIAEDGEILVKGPNVMLGYYNNPAATAEVIDKDGWFHTGDIGEVDKDGFLKITDRKKQIFKTSGGKYIAPAPIENKLQESPYIEQSMVVGENQKFASVLIVPSFMKLKEWCAENGINYTTDAEMIKNEKIKQLITQEVEKVNADLAQYEKIKHPILLAQEWTVMGGQLTPKLSYRRKVVTFENKELIEKNYTTAK
jgi:long-chain acyl-CoA synthetase